EVGASVYRLLVDVTRRLGRPLSTLGAVLGFGCGPGRALRYLLRHARAVAFAGCDVDARAIGWSHAQVPFGDFRVNRETPPTDFPRSSFDLVYAISVFSHLAEGNHLAWLRELRRIAKPGAIVILTVHGEHALRRAESEEAPFRFLSVTRADLAGARERLAA